MDSRRVTADREKRCTIYSNQESLHHTVGEKCSVVMVMIRNMEIVIRNGKGVSGVMNVEDLNLTEHLGWTCEMNDCV